MRKKITTFAHNLPNCATMQHIIIYDTPEDFGNLLPITFTRPISNIRVGITTMREKWEALLPGHYCVETADFMCDEFPCEIKEGEDTLHVCASVFPTSQMAEMVSSLKSGQELVDSEGLVIAYRGDCRVLKKGEESYRKEGVVSISFKGECHRLKYVYDIFLKNAYALKEDFARLTEGRDSVAPDKSNLIIGDYEDETGRPLIFIEEGAIVEGANLNTREGPIYIGVNAKIMEGSCVRGGLALCENAQIRMGAKVYGATTLGPWCKAGGELSNVVMLGYSNKSHDGYLGNAVIGEWCNIGAGVNASNLKNDYSKIRIWNYVQKRFVHTGLQFCGLIMGDHSKAGVNCMFNTATVLGVGVNVHGSGFPRVFVPSFSEGSASAGFSDVSLKKFFDIASRVMSRRGLEISEKQKAIFEYIYQVSQNHK